MDSLSIIMPSLNEQINIINAINESFKAVDLYHIKAEIVVINDGSTDSTRKLVEEYIKKNKKRSVHLVNHEKPMGIGYSFMDGVKNASNDVVVMFPGDNENNPFSALEFFYLMSNVDILVPFIHNVEVRDKFRRLLSSLYRFIINMSFGISLNYTNGTVFYRKCLLKDVLLQTTGFFYQAELLIKLIRKGYLFAEVPNILSVRSSGKTKAVSVKSFLNVAKSYLYLIYQIHIKRIEGIRNLENLSLKSMTCKKVNHSK
jgi:dolichol-phosphate mannosyltransferase